MKSLSLAPTLPVFDRRALLRFSAFGYLNQSDIQRDGGVMRAKMKFVGPTIPVPGQPDATNPDYEWDGSTGIFTKNPDAADATQTSTDFGVTIDNSGVLSLATAASGGGALGNRFGV